MKYTIKCKICNKEVIKQRAKDQPPPIYCSKKCYNESGHKNYNRDGLSKGWGKYGFKKGDKPWNSGTSKGYIHKASGHKIICVNGKEIAEHRHVWNKHYGPIPKGMIIHHINQDKTDNRVENLKMVSRKEHGKIHWPNGVNR